MGDAKNKKWFPLSDNNVDEDIDKIKLYPFVEYIKKNLSSNTFMLLCEVLPDVEFGSNKEKIIFWKRYI